MRGTLVLTLAALVLVAGCTDAPSAPPGASLLVTDAASGLVAVSTVGACNVRVLLVRGPSIVRLREVFVPDGETVSDLHWQQGDHRLIIDTQATRFALDPATGRFARIGQDPAGLAHRTPAAARG